MWIPILASLRERFAFEATVEVPEGYEVVSTGEVRKEGSRRRVRSSVPGPDVPLIVSDRLLEETREGKGVPVTVYHGGAPDSVVSFVADQATCITEGYEGRFEAGRKADRLRVVLAPVERASRSSYARPGLISLRHGVEPDTGLVSLLAHEAAHLWWTDAADPMSRHNFLNESFAEYESWRALRAVYGEEAFRKRLKKARKRAKGAPSFYDWSPGEDGALSYNKGPILLHRLQRRIGEEAYLAFARRLQREEVGTLEGMIEALKETAGLETARWLEDQL